jgi:hypothetical protein
MGGARYKGAWLSIQWNSRERRAAEITHSRQREKRLRDFQTLSLHRFYFSIPRFWHQTRNLILVSERYD